MLDHHIKTLTEFSRWLSRTGNKYPRPGCAPTTSDITTAIKVVSSKAKASSMINPNDLLCVLTLANAGAVSTGKSPSSFKCIKAVSKIVNKLKKCQDTENQQTTPQN